jgi:sulfur relay (sulfurtransferase) complex TusBCD TusD component (DsrE family)
MCRAACAAVDITPPKQHTHHLTSSAGVKTHLCRATKPARGIRKQKAAIMAAAWAMCIVQLGLTAVLSCLFNTAC